MLAFVGDRDSHVERERDLRAGIAAAHADGHCLVAGIAIEEIEAWVLAACGEVRSETSRFPGKRLESFGVALNTEAYVARIEGCDLDDIPEDATELRAFTAAARSEWPESKSP